MSKLEILEKYIIENYNKIKISSFDIKKGDIFLALQGNNYHGNKFIKNSIKKGAKFCITDRKFKNANQKIIFVENIFSFLNLLASKKRDLYKGKVVGITGSAGKTTLKETLAFFLRKNYKISYSQKSYNNELGVLISILNLNLKSKFALFEIGTNNFGEIKNLTKIIQPEEMFITNIQSTHLENFKTKKNIAKEKSDIFNKKYNINRKKLYLSVTNQYEKLIFNQSKKDKKLKVLTINKISNKYFIKKIIKINKIYKVDFSINKKIFTIQQKLIIMSQLINILFCYAFFSENRLSIEKIHKQQKSLKPVDGRGLSHIIFLNKYKLKVIDESYNANPDTMIQSIDYFNKMNKRSNQKILILGNMNELGNNSDKIHLKLLKDLDKNKFKFIILCGEFFRTSIKKLIKPKNNFFYIEKKNNIMKFLRVNIHNNDTLMIKCSNVTEVNKFTKDLLKKKEV